LRRGGVPASEPFIGSACNQSLADLNNSFEVVWACGSYRWPGMLDSARSRCARADGRHSRWRWRARNARCRAIAATPGTSASCRSALIKPHYATLDGARRGVGCAIPRPRASFRGIGRASPGVRRVVRNADQVSAAVICLGVRGTVVLVASVIELNVVSSRQTLREHVRRCKRLGQVRGPTGARRCLPTTLAYPKTGVFASGTICHAGESGW